MKRPNLSSKPPKPSREQRHRLPKGFWHTVTPAQRKADGVVLQLWATMPIGDPLCVYQILCESPEDAEEELQEYVEVNTFGKLIRQVALATAHRYRLAALKSP